MASPTVDYLLGIPLLHKHAVTDITGLGPFLQGGILYGGASGDIAQSLLGLYWDSATDRFSVGTNSNYTAKASILCGSDTEKGVVIRRSSTPSVSAFDFQDASGNVQLCIDSNYALACTPTSTTQQIQARSRTLMGSVGGNFTFEVKRDGTNNFGNGAILKLTDNAVSAQLKWMSSSFSQNVMDFEIHNANGKCYAAPYDGGNYYYNPVVNTQNLSILRIPAQNMAPGAGTPSPQGAFRVSVCTTGATSPVSITDVAMFWIEGAPTQGTNMTIANRYASLIQTGDQNGIGVGIRGSNPQTRNLQQWEDYLSAVLASIDGAGNFKCQGFGAKVASKTSTYTAADENVILCDASSGAFTINLPAAASFTDRQYVIKKTDSSANAITIDGNSSETIDGATTQALTVQYQSITIACNGSNWFII